MKMSDSGLNEETKSALNEYNRIKTQIGIDKETSLIACSNCLSDIYLDIINNENWQKSPCLGGEDTGCFHDRPFFKGITDTTITNLHQFNSEVEFLVTEFEKLPPPSPNNKKIKEILRKRANMIKNFQALRLAEHKTDCALSVMPIFPDIPYSNYGEYRLAKKVYLRTMLETPESKPLHYLNRTKKTRKFVPIPTTREISDEKNRTSRQVPMDLSDFDELSGIKEMKELPIMGKVLNPQELDNLTLLLGKSIPSPLVTLDRLPEHAADEVCCPCVRKMCTIL